MLIDEPLPRPWRTTQVVCCWGSLVAWAVLWVNVVTADADWVSGAALALAVLFAVGLVAATLLGRKQRDRRVDLLQIPR